jgi:hypothetical protein
MLVNRTNSGQVVRARRFADGHIWTHEKGNPNAPPRDVTARKADAHSR